MTLASIRTDTVIRCHHGIALVGGFDTHPEVQHDGTGMFPGESLACDDVDAKACKVTQAQEVQRQERARTAAKAAGRRSAHATRLTYEQRCDRYARQNNGRQLTPRQQRRIGKKIDGAFYAALHADGK